MSLKAFGVSAILALCIGTGVATGYAFIEIDKGVSQYNKQTHVDSRVILGHRIGPDGNLHLVYGK